MKTWEQARIDRLEHRVDQLERKSWERADFTFRLVMYGLTAAMVVLNIVTIAIAASSSGP
jgi:quinol-cytochrome oxidoreductase complex cytochrome b subunit